MLLALAIFIITLVLVIWQPKGLGIGWSALSGAALAMVSGVVQPSDIAVVWAIVWDATFTFVALIIISLILDRAGFFAWAALHVARWGSGRGHLLFPLVVVLGAVISAFFANDGAALILTPIVIAFLAQLNFRNSTIFAFIIATGFVADTTSLPLVISNLVNIVTANYFDISFVNYASVMAVVNLISLIATLFVLWLVFRKDIPSKYSVAGLDLPSAAIKDKLVFQISLPLLLVLLLAYFITAPFAIPVSLVTGIAAFILIILAGRWWSGGNNAVISVSDVLRHAPWQIVLFSIGMYLVVYGLGQAGLTEYGVQVLHLLAQQGDFIATIGTGFFVAVVASVMNNMPSTLLSALAIDQANVSGLTEQLMIYASIIGNDLGPKLTPIGSLATLLWLHVLSAKGYRISWGQYMKVGLLITPPVLLAVLLSLYLLLSM